MEAQEQIRKATAAAVAAHLAGKDWLGAMKTMKAIKAMKAKEGGGMSQSGILTTVSFRSSVRAR